MRQKIRRKEGGEGHGIGNGEASGDLGQRPGMTAWTETRLQKVSERVMRKWGLVNTKREV